MPDRLRVVLVVTDPGDDWGQQAAALLPGLLEHGLDAHLVVERVNAPRTGAFAGLEPEVAQLRVHPPAREQRGEPRPGLRRDLAGALRRRPLSLRRLLEPGLDTAGRYTRAVLLALAPSVVHVGSRAAAARWTAPARDVGARLVLGLDPWEESEDAGQAPAGVVVVVARALPPAAAQAAAPWAGGPLHVLSGGRLAWTGGFEYGLQAVRLLREQGVDCRQRIVGTGPFLDALGFARHQLGLTGVVELVDLPAAALVDHLGWAHVFAVPAVALVSPGATLAALGCGLPVVTTDPPAGAGDAVLAVPRRDPAALAAAFGRVVREPGLQGRLAAAGLAYARARAGSDDPAAELAALYRSLAGR